MLPLSPLTQDKFNKFLQVFVVIIPFDTFTIEGNTFRFNPFIYFEKITIVNEIITNRFGAIFALTFRHDVNVQRSYDRESGAKYHVRFVGGNRGYLCSCDGLAA